MFGGRQSENKRPRNRKSRTPLAKITALQEIFNVGSIVFNLFLEARSNRTVKLEAKLDTLRRRQDIDRRRDELKLQEKEQNRLNEQEELNGELSAVEAIQKILQESELNDTIALQEATNSVDTKEKQRISNNSGPNILELPQQIQANSSVSDGIKGQDDKVNAPVALTTTPSKAPSANERIASTSTRTLLNFPS